MNKRVLRIITRLNVGGPTKHVSWLSSGLVQYGWQGLLVAGAVEPDEDDMSEFARLRGVEIYYLESLKRSIALSADFVAIIDIYRILTKFRPAIVHTHMAKAGLAGRLAVMVYNLFHREKIKTVHTFHGHTFHGYFSPLKGAFFLWLERMLARFGTNAIITISPQQQVEIMDVYRVGSAQQHRQINLGVDFGFAKALDRTSLRRELNIPSSAKVFGIVGRIAEIKNHKLFIDSARHFQNNFDGEDVWFLIIGDGDPSYVHELKIYADDLSRVVFAGNRTIPEVFYGALDYLVLTSKNEGTPVSILESFACGLPVVSTPVGGVVDLIGKNERGILVEADAIKIAACYEAMLGVKHEEICIKSREFVEENYSIDGLVKKIDCLYNELLLEGV